MTAIVGAVVVVATALTLMSAVGRSLICKAVPLCGDALKAGESVHKVSWSSVDPDRPSLRLHVPREYVNFYIKPTKEDPTEFITLATSLPNLGPRSLRSGQSCAKPGSVECEARAKRVDDFDVRLRSDSSMGLHQPSASIGKPHWAAIYPRFERETDKMGLQHYVERGGPGQCVRRDLVEGDSTVRPELLRIAAATTDKYVCWQDGDEIFVSVGSASEPDTVIRCGPLFESVRFGPKCVAEINFNTWRVTYMFPGSEFGRWREFDTGTRKLLQNLSATQ